jgi:hypothetical protein
MDHQSLRRLADDGLAAYPPVDITTLADWCWEYGEATGDARYSSLWRALRSIVCSFEDTDALPTLTVMRIDALLRESVPDIVDAESPEAGAQLARRMREDLLTILNA